MLYQWTQESAISKAVIRSGKRGVMEAELHAGSDAASGSLAALAAALRDKGFEVSPDANVQADGAVEHVLRVRGRMSEQAMLSEIGASGVTVNAASVSAVPPESKPKQTFMQRLRERSLQVAGGLYLVGDVLLIGSGYLRNQNDPYKKGGGLAEAGVGIAFGVSDVLLSMYGRKNPHRVRRGLVGEGLNYLEADGATLEHDRAITGEARTRGGFLAKMDDFFYKQLIPVKSVFEIVGGGLYVKAGKAQNNPWKMGSGLSIISGFIASLLVPEKAPHEKHAEGPAPKGILGSIFKDGPMKFTGFMALMNNALLMTGAYRERKNFDAREAELLDKQREAVGRYNTSVPGAQIINPDHPEPELVKNLSDKFGDVKDSVGKLQALRSAKEPLKIKGKNLGTPYLLNAIAAGFLASANVLLLLSKKNQDGVGNTKEMDDIYTLPAVAYLELPPEERQRKIDGYAGYMSEKLKFSRTAEQISESIQQKIAALESSPFLTPVSHAPQTRAERDVAEIMETQPPLPDAPAKEAAPAVPAPGHDVPEGGRRVEGPIRPEDYQTVARPAPAPAQWAERQASETPSAQPSLP